MRVSGRSRLWTGISCLWLTISCFPFRNTAFTVTGHMQSILLIVIVLIVGQLKGFSTVFAGNH